MDEKIVSDKSEKGSFSLEFFIERIYQDYILSQNSNGRIVLNNNKKQNHERMLELYKAESETKYQEALEALETVKKLSEDRESMNKLLRLRRKGLSSVELLNAYKNGELKDDFSYLRENSLISSNNMSLVVADTLRKKYQGKIVIIDGKDEYYIEKSHKNKIKLVSGNEVIELQEEGVLTYHNWEGISDYISRYMITKNDGEKELKKYIFTRISQDKFDDEEYLNALANFLFSDQHLLSQSYGGYIGEIEKKSNSIDDNSIEIPSMANDTQKNCIYYDSEVLTAAMLFQEQLDKDKRRKSKLGLSEEMR